MPTRCGTCPGGECEAAGREWAFIRIFSLLQKPDFEVHESFIKFKGWLVPFPFIFTSNLPTHFVVRGDGVSGEATYGFELVFYDSINTKVAKNNAEIVISHQDDYFRTAA